MLTTMENAPPTLKLPRRMVVIIVLVALIGLLSGILVGLLPCQYCKKPVLQVGKYRAFGEHLIFCPFRDK